MLIHLKALNLVVKAIIIIKNDVNKHFHVTVCLMGVVFSRHGMFSCTMLVL